MSTTPRVAPAMPAPPNAFAGAFAHQGALFATFSQWYGEFWSRGVLDPALKETVRLRNARVTDCGY